MSTKIGAKAKKVDRRVRRTRDALGDALIFLIQEKPFDTITVQDVLDRAGVGRSTFYVHYRDKNDLFMSDAEEFLELSATALSRAKDKTDRIAAVREFFAHVREGQKLYQALVASGKIHDFMELARGHFARGISQRLGEMDRAAGVPPPKRDLIAQALASALLALMIWWIDHGCRESPAEMEETFQRLVWRGISP